MKKKLYLSQTDKKICGVCGGIAEYFDIDSTLVRLAVALAVIFAGTGVWVYIVCALIIPKEPPMPEDRGYYDPNYNYPGDQL